MLNIRKNFYIIKIINNFNNLINEYENILLNINEMHEKNQRFEKKLQEFYE